MILKDIIALLREEARNAHVVNDERIDDRIWQDFIMLKRNTFIKNHLNEKQFTELNTLQTEKLTLSAFDSVYDTTGVSIGSKILRSGVVPKMIESRVGPAVYTLTGADLISPTIEYVPFDRLRWCGNGIINKHMLFAAWYDNRFYVKSGSEIEKPLKYLNLTAIFSDPTEVSTYTDTSDYPVNEYMIDYMKNEIQKADVQMMLQRKADEINNSSGEL
jgi:hypothetical protein